MRNAARRGHQSRAIVQDWRKLVNSVPIKASVPPTALAEGASAPVPAASVSLPDKGQPVSHGLSESGEWETFMDNLWRR